jgi:ribonuclease HII
MTGESLIKMWRRAAVAKCPHVGLSPYLGLSEDGVEYLRLNPPRLVIGADEVGYGSIAGPVTVAAVAAEPGWHREGLRDSKKLSPERIIGHAHGIALDSRVKFAICSIDNERIDRWGLAQARQVAFEECLENLREQIGEDFNYSLIVLDGDVEARHIDHIKLPKADDIVQQVSAASVIAKNNRDHWMIKVAHSAYPAYGFDQHVGYGTEQHRRVLTALGPSPLHRTSFTVKPYRGKT